ncbi:MAG: hypothetical protein M1436_06530 [Acidobacteria bacterium]|nr:hypothetical protein [Acidobacteriota bacterium]
MQTAPYLTVFLLLSALGQSAFCQHGVIREYAALAPTAEAVPLKPLLDEPLTDASIALGPDRAFYLTGSKASDEGPVFASKISIWRSTGMRRWTKIREVDFGSAAVRSPEIHYLKGRFWLTAGLEHGGTELLRFDKTDLAASAFERKRITERGEDPSLFLDDDGTFYWVCGAGEVARMKPDPMDGLAAELKPVIAPLRGELRSARMHGAFLEKIHGFYHLFVAERLLRHGDLGRTGLPGGTEDTFVAVSSRPDSGYSEKRYLAFPHAGQTTIFHDPRGALWATFSCTDTRGIFRLKPGAFKVEQVDASKPVWPIGFDFDSLDPPRKYSPQAVMLRPFR